jgi:Fe-S-cluster containining protein
VNENQPVVDDRPSFPLREHHLTHIDNLHVGEELLTSRFAASSSMMACSARCCREGVLVDIAHRDRILAEAPMIVEYMEPTQQRDPSRWFHDEDEVDTDFPSGRAVNTNSHNGACVFLDSMRRCALQRAEERSPHLKPFFCRAFPIAIVSGRVTLDVEWCPGETQCCSPVAGGDRPALEVCHDELAHLLGAAGMRELHRVADRAAVSAKPA